MLDSEAARASGRCSKEGRTMALPSVTEVVVEEFGRECSHRAHIWPSALPSSGSLTMKG